jgi:hypothetical protein
VTLTRSAGFLQVVQSLGPSGGAPFRTVDILMNDATKLPNQLSFDDGTGPTTWTYTYDTSIPSAPGRLATVQPPLGPVWEFTYEPFGQGKLLQVSTPQGGTITYTYREQPFQVGPNPMDVEQVTVIHTRTVGGREVISATWEFAFLMDSGTSAGQAEVTLPLGAKVTYS